MAKFVVHEHKARTLHWDLRLEIGFVLKSWAIPKEPPLKPGIKRLAIPTTDHPLEYINFTGIIEKGEYGAGKVEIWDTGTYKLVDQKPYKMVLEMNGRKLKGKYVLLQFKDKRGKKNWLFFKIKP